MKTIDKICYMCSKPAVSREHVPPICLFPEEKDIRTSMFRNNLITVPSCELHNSKKSKDDEFLMTCMAGVVGNNFLGYFHTHTKVKRAIIRKGQAFRNTILEEIQETHFKNENGVSFPVLIGRPNFDRLYSCFKNIAYGLYYHKFGKRFEGESQIMMDFLTFEDEQTEKIKLLVRKRLEEETEKPEIEGANPEIFSYAFYRPDEFGLISLVMTFYQGSKVLVAFKETGIKEPFNLTMKLINSGVKTHVEFDDGTDFEFN